MAVETWNINFNRNIFNIFLKIFQQVNISSSTKKKKNTDRWIFLAFLFFNFNRKAENGLIWANFGLGLWRAQGNNLPGSVWQFSFFFFLNGSAPTVLERISNKPLFYKIRHLIQLGRSGWLMWLAWLTDLRSRADSAVLGRARTRFHAMGQT